MYLQIQFVPETRIKPSLLFYGLKQVPSQFSYLGEWCNFWNKAPEMFYGLLIFTRLSISVGVSRESPNLHFWMNSSFKKVLVCLLEWKAWCMFFFWKDLYFGRFLFTFLDQKLDKKKRLISLTSVCQTWTYETTAMAFSLAQNTVFEQKQKQILFPLFCISLWIFYDDPYSLSSNTVKCCNYQH